MSELLSQEEIDKLLNSKINKNETEKPVLTNEEIDGLGEIGNISMGTAATTLSVLLNQKVNITTPKVSVAFWKDIADSCESGLMLIKVRYKEGLKGSSILLIKESDAKIICNLMMGGDGRNVDEEISDLHLSAIGEAMNQMIGSSSTSISEMLNTRVDIDPPQVYSTSLDSKTLEEILDEEMKSYFVKTSFRITIGDLVDSNIMQLIALPFGKEMFQKLIANCQQMDCANKEEASKEKASNKQEDSISENSIEKGMPGKKAGGSNSRGDSKMDMFMDISLEVAVELGRTNRAIKDVLKLGPGSIVELDSFSGEFVNIYVNGKNIAKGEIVVVGENYGVRITDILKAENRI